MIQLILEPEVKPCSTLHRLFKLNIPCAEALLLQEV